LPAYRQHYSCNSSCNQNGQLKSWLFCAVFILLIGKNYQNSPKNKAQIGPYFVTQPCAVIYPYKTTNYKIITPYFWVVLTVLGNNPMKEKVKHIFSIGYNMQNI